MLDRFSKGNSNAEVGLPGCHFMTAAGNVPEYWGD